MYINTPLGIMLSGCTDLMLSNCPKLQPKSSVSTYTCTLDEFPGECDYDLADVGKSLNSLADLFTVPYSTMENSNTCPNYDLELIEAC